MTTTAKCKIHLTQTLAGISDHSFSSTSSQGKGKSRQNSSKGKARNSKTSSRSKGKFTERYSMDSLEMSSFSKTSLGMKLNQDELGHDVACGSRVASELNELDNDIESAIMGMSPGLPLDEDDNKEDILAQSNGKYPEDMPMPSEDTFQRELEEEILDRKVSSCSSIRPLIEDTLHTMLEEKSVDDSLHDKQQEESGSSENDNRKKAEDLTKAEETQQNADCDEIVNDPEPNLTATTTQSEENTASRPTITKNADCDEIVNDPEPDLTATTTPSEDNSASKPTITDASTNTTTGATNTDTLRQAPGPPPAPSSPSSRQRRAAVILAVVTGVFIVCRTPYVGVRLAAIACSSCIQDAAYQAMFWLGWGLALINPFLYAFISTAFREYCKRVLKKAKERCCCLCKACYK
jgi:hypothetical protein